MNYCKHLKKRKNKPYCKLLDKKITLSECNKINSDNKCREYRNDIKISNNNQTRNSAYSLHNSAKTLQKIKNKSKKRITVSKETYNSVIERDNYSCRLCGSMQELQLHHIDGRGKYKTNNINNCIMLCRRCHLDVVHKNNKYWRRKLRDII